jgi:hypothetical protein
MPIPNLTTANSFGEMVNDVQQLISLMNALTDGSSFNANTILTVTRVNVANLQVSAISGLNTSSVVEATSNLYFTAARARANVSNTAPLNYDSTNGVFSHANSGVTAAVHANATHIPVITVNDSGHITSVANTKLKTSTYKSNTLVGVAGALNFIPGANISLVMGNDSTNDNVHIVIDGVWGGGPNPLGHTTIQVGGVSATTNTNTVNFLVHQGIGIVATQNGATTDVRVEANGIYALANLAYIVGDAAATAANTNATAAKIRANVTNTAPVTYDSSTGTFGLAASGRITTATNTAISYTGARSVLSATAPLSYNSGTGDFSLATSGVTATGYGSTTTVPTFTVDQFGRITGCSNTAISYTGARTVISGTSPISYDSGTGVISHATSGVTATGYGDSVTIPVLVVNTTGHVTSVTNTAIRAGSTSQTGVLSLTDSVSSTSTTTAATPNAVRSVNNSITALQTALGTMAYQSNTNVNIGGGSISNTSVAATRVLENWQQLTPSAGAVTIDMSAAGSTYIIDSSPTTISFSNLPADGKTAGHVITVQNFNNITWPGTVSWGTAGKPSIAGFAIVSLYTYQASAVWFASVIYS